MTKLTVIGCGYLGAVHAACMAQLGHDVIGIDVDAPKVALLASGRTPFFEPGFEEVLQSALASGRLSFTSDMSAAKGSDVHFVCVGTPQKRNEYAADMALSMPRSPRSSRTCPPATWSSASQPSRWERPGDWRTLSR